MNRVEAGKRIIGCWGLSTEQRLTALEVILTNSPKGEVEETVCKEVLKQVEAIEMACGTLESLLKK